MTARQFRRKLGGRKARKMSRKAQETYVRLIRKGSKPKDRPSHYRHDRQAKRDQLRAKGEL